MSTTAPNLQSYSATAWTSSDPVVYAENFPQWQLSYEPSKRGPYEFSCAHASLGQLELASERISVGGVWRGQGWKGCRLFLLSTQIHHLNQRLIPGGSLVSWRWNGIEEMITGDSTSSVQIAVDERWLINRLCESTGTEFHFSDDGRPVLCQCHQSLVQKYEREVPEILRQLIAEPAILNSDASRASVQNYAADLLVPILTADKSSQAPLPRPTTRAYVVDRAMQYIESAIGDSVSMLDICKVLRVSPRTLHYSFESVLGVSPSRYLQATRLQRVHRDLRTAPPDVSIQHLATRWGFWHLGRFAEYYRETFGERPSDTARAAAASGYRGMRGTSTLHR